MKVLVGSQNPVKIDAVREAFSRYFNEIEIINIDVESGIGKQPINDDTFKGAQNRADELKKINDEDNMDADLFVGIEGGIKKLYSRWFSFGAICIMDKNGNVAFGSSPHFEIPSEMADELLQGKKFGEVIDRMSGNDNTKQNEGAIGFFTKGRMNRKELYIPGLMVALVPLLNEDIFFKKGYF